MSTLVTSCHFQQKYSCSLDLIAVVFHHNVHGKIKRVVVRVWVWVCVYACVCLGGGSLII